MIDRYIHKLILEILDSLNFVIFKFIKQQSQMLEVETIFGKLPDLTAPRPFKPHPSISKSQKLHLYGYKPQRLSNIVPFYWHSSSVIIESSFKSISLYCLLILKSGEEKAGEAKVEFRELKFNEPCQDEVVVEGEE